MGNSLSAPIFHHHVADEVGLIREENHLRLTPLFVVVPFLVEGVMVIN